jgi:hypothetical protein
VIGARPGWWAAAVAAACVLSAAAAPRPAGADTPAPPAASGPPLVGVVDAGDGLVLVGRAGQVYRPAGGGRWRRVAAGGVGPDLAGAAWRGDVLLGLPARTPMFRFDGASWHSSRVGQNGKLLAGSGLTNTLAIGRHLFGFRDGKWVRLAFAPEAVRAVWSGRKNELVVAGVGGVYQQRGQRLVKIGSGQASAIVGGRAWAWTPTGLVALMRPVGAASRAPARRPLPAPGSVVAAATSRDGRGLVLVDDGRVVRLVVLTDVAAPVVVDSPIPPGAAVGGVAADPDRVVVVVGAVVHLYQGGAWSTAELEGAVAAPGGGPGPGPARTR